MKTHNLFLLVAFLLTSFYVNAQTSGHTQPLRFSMAYDSLKVNLHHIPKQKRPAPKKKRHFGAKHQEAPFFVSQLLPNNAADNTCLEIQTPVEKTVTIYLYDENDRVISKMPVILLPGQNKLPIYLYEIGNGYYTIGVRRPNGKWNFRSLMVEKG